MPVPEGLAGMRVDAGLARLLGLSRTAAAAVAEDGGVEIDGVRAGKSDRLTGGAWLSVTLPEAPAPVENTPIEIEGMTILYSDDDIVAVDKPPGVAAHATVGWHGPTVLGGLAAAGFRISTSGVHERQGIVQRLDAGTSGVMVVALSEHAYTVLKRAFKQRTVDKRYHAVVQGHPDPSSGTIDAPIGRHRGNDWKFAVTEGGRHSITHYDSHEEDKRPLCPAKSTPTRRSVRHFRKLSRARTFPHRPDSLRRLHSLFLVAARTNQQDPANAGPEQGEGKRFGHRDIPSRATATGTGPGHARSQDDRSD